MRDFGLGFLKSGSYLKEAQDEFGIMIPFFTQRIILSSGDNLPCLQYSQAGVFVKLNNFFILYLLITDKILT